MSLRKHEPVRSAQTPIATFGMAGLAQGNQGNRCLLFPNAFNAAKVYPDTLNQLKNTAYKLIHLPGRKTQTNSDIK